MSSGRIPIAEIPRGPVAVPPTVRGLTAGRPLEPVWVNGLGAPTFRDDGPGGSGASFVKWADAGTPEIDFAAEADRLRWAAAHGASVPEVLGQGSDLSGSWLVTRALEGESAVATRWIAEPRTAALAIGAGLRELHERLPVVACPYSWSIADRLRWFEERVAAGEDTSNGDAAYGHLSVDEVRRLLHAAPPVDEPVVCHGDACAPNTLIARDGSFAAHVDLGSLGVADRWADLAVAAWSTEWNYGPGYEGFVYAGYGIDPDPERIAYYRLLWNFC